VKRKRHKPHEIIRILREAEGGNTITSVCAEHNISEQTFYRWRRKFGNMSENEATRLRYLEDENRRLKKLLADRGLEVDLLKEISSKKW
jgi:putative transposase